MRKSIEVIFNLLLWCIITYIFYYVAKSNAHIASQAVNNYGMFHIPWLAFVIFFTVAPNVISFYIFYLILIPKLLLRKKYILFLSIALLSSVIVGFGYRMTYGGSGVISRLVFFTIMALFWGIIGSAFKGIFLFIDSLAEKRILERKNLKNKNALLLLKAQLNPHFLFNSLNNIDILIEENPKTASEYLKKLSDILRYVVYETSEEETDLSKEIMQIKSYIDLNKIRTSNPNYVNFSLSGESKDRKIAPMLFIPFIENAFKHSRNKMINNAIEISFEIKDDSVKMECKNYFEPVATNVIKNEGKGIETIKQRLNLLYPKYHRLIIDIEDNRYTVSLEISFKK